MALVSKLFSNLRHFSTCLFRTDVLPSLVVGSVVFKEGKHLQTFSLRRLTACDMTRTLGLAGGYAYLPWTRGSEAPLRGERVW